MENTKAEKKDFAAKPYTQEEVDKILKEIDEKLTGFIKSDKFKDVLLMMGNLGKYSFTNIIYILLQNPDAVTVNGMKQWNYLGRSIKPYTQEEVDKILKEIDEKLTGFIKSDKFKDVLLMMGNLGKYSFTNIIYILLQNPDAVTVNGMKQWNYLGRSIKPGEKSIKIFAPIKETVLQDVLDKDGNPTLDDEGNPVKKKKEIVKGFKPSFVFDISQTKGREFQAYKMDEKTPVEDKEIIMRGLTQVVAKKGFTVEYADQKTLGKGCYGQCNRKDKKILLLEGMSDLQTVSTMVHECGHALAHTPYRSSFEGLTESEKREIKEVEAESIACVVCSHLGLDTENFNFSYISGWAEGDVSKFRKNMDVIGQYAGELIGGIEDSFQQDRIAKYEAKKQAEAENQKPVKKRVIAPPKKQRS